MSTRIEQRYMINPTTVRQEDTLLGEGNRVVADGWDGAMYEFDFTLNPELHQLGRLFKRINTRNKITVLMPGMREQAEDFIRGELGREDIVLGPGITVTRWAGLRYDHRNIGIWTRVSLPETSRVNYSGLNVAAALRELSSRRK